MRWTAFSFIIRFIVGTIGLSLGFGAFLGCFVLFSRWQIVSLRSCSGFLD